MLLTAATRMTQSVRRSLFVRLLLIFGSMVLMLTFVVYWAVSQINEDPDSIESIPNFFTRNIESIVEDIGTPPNLNNAMRLADELEWIINIRNPVMRWSSNADQRLDVDRAVFTRALSADAEVRSIGNEDIIKVQRGGYDFYLYRRTRNDNDFSYPVLYITLTLAAAVLLLNYFMVSRLLSPVRLLQQGAERIRQGDLGFRVKSGGQDELGVLTDSINHMADSLQSMLEAKRQLLLAISHELRTPITRVKLRMEFMPDSDEKERLREDIDVIERLISDLIEAERLNDAHSLLSEEKVMFAGFVASVAARFEGHAGGLELHTPERDREIVIDKLRLRLLLTNLLNNAVRHGGRKSIRVRVSFEDAAEESGQETARPETAKAVLEVIDQGEGIAAEHLARVCEPFYRADSARQRDTGGSGLGLYLCRLIAKAHGGALHISSEPGRGTHITVTLPPRPPSTPAKQAA